MLFNNLSKPIKFFSDKDRYFELSNHFMKPFSLDGDIYESSEHYFQAQKFKYPEATAHTLKYSKLICQADCAFKATDMGIQRVNYRGCLWYLNEKRPKLGMMNDVIHQYCITQLAKPNPEWDTIQIDVMRKAIGAKFSQNYTLETLLLDTGDRQIIYSNPNDSFWGVGDDNKGENHLGRLLMELREILRIQNDELRAKRKMELRAKRENR